MELIDRYLQAVGFWLPKAQREDIIAELSEDIRSQIENKEGELGNKVDDGEIEAILKRCGHPLLVAQRYLPQQQLIGPVLFPIYRFVLKIFSLVFVVPWLLAWLGFVIFSPAYRSHYPIHRLAELWSVIVHSLFFITLGFAIIQKFNIDVLALKDWNPRKLPPVHDSGRIPRSSSIFDLTAGVAFIILWISVLRFRTDFELAGATITLVPEWQYFLCGFLLVSLITVVMSAINLFQPSWTRVRAGIRLAIDCLGSTLLCWLLKFAMVAKIVAPNVSPERTMATTNAINIGLSQAFWAAVILSVVVMLLDVRRILRVKRTVTRLSLKENES